MILDQKTDRLKLWFLYTGEEDERLAKAATSAMALITSQSPECCRRIPKECPSCWTDLLKEMAMREDPEWQYRGLMVISNMIQSDYEVAAKILQTEIFEVNF